MTSDDISETIHLSQKYDFSIKCKIWVDILREHKLWRFENGGEGGRELFSNFVDDTITNFLHFEGTICRFNKTIDMQHYMIDARTLDNFIKSTPQEIRNAHDRTFMYIQSFLLIRDSSRTFKYNSIERIVALGSYLADFGMVDPLLKSSWADKLSTNSRGLYKYKGPLNLVSSNASSEALIWFEQAAAREAFLTRLVLLDKSSELQDIDHWLDIEEMISDQFVGVSAMGTGGMNGIVRSISTRMPISLFLPFSSTIELPERSHEPFCAIAHYSFAQIPDSYVSLQEVQSTRFLEYFANIGWSR